MLLSLYNVLDLYRVIRIMRSQKVLDWSAQATYAVK